MKLHFISGLPRSGSTLLAAILRQNPRFRAGMSSPVAQIVMQIHRSTSRAHETASLINDEQRRRILQGVFKGFYGAVRPGNVIFDTNRAWCAKLPLLAALYSDAKVICTVRDIPWILNSVEKLIRSNPLELSGIFGFQAGGTVFDRVNCLVAPDGIVGYALNGLREAYASELADRLLIIDYEALTRKPDDVIRYIYKFVNEDFFEHDFDNVFYEAENFDQALGTPGLHTVKGPVRWRDDSVVIPEELFIRFRGDSFWKNQNNNYRRVATIMFESSRA